jgi:phage terminase small subunit
MTAGKSVNGINDQQERFCQSYAATLSVSEAARNAGYSIRYAYDLAEKPHIRERIKEIQRHELGERVEVDQLRVMRETAYLAFSDITETLGVEHSVEGLKALPARVRKAIKKVKTRHYNPPNGDPYTQVEIEMHSKHEPLKLLAICTGATQDPRDNDDELPFTGFDVIMPDGRQHRLTDQAHQQQGASDDGDSAGPGGSEPASE